MGRLLAKPAAILGVIGGIAAVLLFTAAALAAVDPGTYTPTADSFNSANAPGSSNLKSGTVACVVSNDSATIACSAYTLAGVGHTNADVSLDATWSATIDCNNPGKNRNNPIESHQTTFSSQSSDTLTSSRNGQLRVPAESASAGSVGQVCPNPNWKPVIRSGTLTLDSFAYTLTFEGFG